MDKKTWTSLKKIIRRANSLMRHCEILVKRLILYISVLFLGYSFTVYMVKLFFLNLTNGMILHEYTYIHILIRHSSSVWFFTTVIQLAEIFTGAVEISVCFHLLNDDFCHDILKLFACICSHVQTNACGNAVIRKTYFWG